LTAHYRICDIGVDVCESAAVHRAIAERRPSPRIEPVARGPERFAFVLVPNFSMIAFASALEPLRIANRMADRELYSWQIVSRDRGPVRASNGCLVTTDQSLADIAIGPGRESPIVIVCSGLGAERIHDGQLFAWLRRADRAGATIGAVCTGAHLLARAGLLKGHKCTIHWENLPGFIEEFPTST
jgi:AraC family transcriptional regulator, glycine betaine-responsive activator